MKKFKIIIAICCFVLSAGLLHAKSTYTVGVENIKYLPYYSVKNGQWVGFARELLSQFAKQSGVDFSYKPRSIKNLYKEYVVQRKFDFKFPDNPYWNAHLKLKNKIHYSESTILFTDGVMVLEENITKGIQSIKKLGVVSGFTYPAKFQAMEKSGKLLIIKQDSLEKMVKTVLDKKIDGVYLNTEVGKHLSRGLSGDRNRLQFNNKLPFLLGTYQLSTIKHPKMILKFNAFLEKNSKWVLRLKQKYNIQ